MLHDEPVFRKSRGIAIYLIFARNGVILNRSFYNTAVFPLFIAIVPYVPKG